MIKASELTDFYMWMVENDYDHNIRMRVEKKAEIYLKTLKQRKELDVSNVVCCGVLEKMNLGWMKLEDGAKCMPFVYGKEKEMLRVNNCPSCGKYVRDAIIE